MCADAAELVDQGEAAQDDLILNDHVTRQRGCVGENGVISHHAIVGDVDIGHQPVVIADPGLAGTINGAAIEGAVFADGVVITDHKGTALAVELLVLGVGSQGREGMDLVVFADMGRPFDHHVGSNHRAAVDVNIRADDTERADANVVGDEATLLHTMGAGPFDNAVAIATPIGLVPFTMSILGRSYGAEASVGAVESTFFFVAPSTRQDRQGNTPLALWQKVGRTGPVELIQGVDDLQVRYGIDTTLADGIANSNQYVSFNSVPANVGQIVAVRVAIAVNSVDAVTDDGNRLQRTFSKTIMVRNANPEA